MATQIGIWGSHIYCWTSASISEILNCLPAINAGLFNCLNPHMLITLCRGGLNLKAFSFLMQKFLGFYFCILTYPLASQPALQPCWTNWASIAGTFSPQLFLRGREIIYTVKHVVNCCGENEVGCGKSGFRGTCGYNSDCSGQGDCPEALIPEKKT